MAALELVRARAGRHHAALCAARARDISAAADAALPDHFRLVAPGRMARTSAARHPLACRGPRAPARASGGGSVQAPFGMGDDGLPAPLSPPGARAQAPALV